jgi:tetratricopeptide (TPR) repeat protein
MIRGIVIALSLVVIVGCGPGKEVTTKSSFTAADYPYIEKFHEGVRLKARGQLDEATVLFEQCIQLRPSDDAPYYALSELYLMKNDQIRSAEYIQKAAKIDPKNIWYVQELAYMYLEQGKHIEAIKQFERLVEYESRNVEWWYAYAECLAKAGKYADAIKALEKTEDQVGQHPELTLQKFQLYMQMKQPEKGIAEIEKARVLFPDDPQILATLVDYYFQKGEVDKAISLLEELVIASPDNGRAHLALADIYRQQGKQQQAYDELKKAFPCTDVDIDTKMKILIGVLEKSTKLDPAVKELVDLVVLLHPNEAKAHAIRGDYMLRIENNAEAIISYKKALEFDKKQYPIWNQVLIMEYQDGKYELLYQDSKACLEFFPSMPTVFVLNGLSAVQTKRYEEAVDVLLAGKDFILKDNSMLSELHGQLGEAYFGLKKLDDAQTNYEKALSLDPSSALLKNNYAYRLALANVNLSRALTLIDEVLNDGNESSHYIDTKGFILFRQAKYAEASVLFEKALLLSPNDKVIVEHVGDVAFKLGNKEKALEYWKKAKELGSTNSQLDKKISLKEYYDPIFQ